VAVPTINATINFSTGPSNAQAMLFDIGRLDYNVFADSAGLVVDVSNQVDRLSTKRGRDAQADKFQTGQLSLRIVDQNGDFNPQNTASPYYGYLDPMRKIQITATWNSITYPIFSGFITSYTTTTPKFTGDIVYTTITAVDAFRLAQNAQISTVTGGTAGQLSGARIGKILDAISWPATMRDIDAGQTTMQADPGTPRTALEAMQTIELSEYGSLYVDASGNFVFQDRLFTTNSVNQTPVVFKDDGTAIGYFNAVWVLNDVLVYNSAQITRAGGTTQSVSNTASINKYFLHSYNQQNLLMETDAVAKDYAGAYVASRAETTTRCDAIVLDLYTDNYDAGITAALSLDYFDPVSITTTQPAAVGTSTLSKTFQVFGVAHDMTPNSWKTTFTTLEPIIDGFIIGTALYGVLGVNVLSY
jgi:hypothetical protein